MSSTTTAHRRATTGRVQTLLDVALAAAALAATLVLLSHGGIRPSSPDASSGWSTEVDLVGVLLAVCSTVPLVAWRRYPFGVFVATAAASVLLASLDYPLDLALGPAVALYLLAAHSPHSRWTRHTTITVVGMFVAYVGAAAAAHGDIPGSELLHSGRVWAVAWFAGERTRLRHAHLAELRERARRTEREAERERLLAAAQERARIARDLHDSAGHAISVIAVRAGAARLRHGEDPDRSLVALEAIEKLARQTASDIDHIVGRLRDSSNATESVETPPGLASLDSLLASHTAAGLAVTLDAVGTPQPLSGPADQAVFRILQEALTNAARHGDGSARVELAFGDTAVDVTITNPMLVADAPRSGGGHGLIGMRERAILLGGDLDTARDNGTFRTHARIPYRGAPA